MKKVFALIVTFVFFAFGGHSASAHGLGQSFEKTVGDYVVDVGYDATGNIVAGEITRFDFNLLTKDKNRQIGFTSLWLRIAPEKGIVLATYLALPEFGLPGMSYVFPKSGSYEITARFYRGTEVLGEVSFPFIVDKGKEEKSSLIQSIGSGVAGLVIGFIAAWFLKNKNDNEIK